MSRERTGTAIGPYLLEEYLDEGTFGEVYRAVKETKLGFKRDNLAVKVLFKENFHLEQVESEVSIWQSASREQHPNILQIVDADTYDDEYVIVSEFIPHGSLEKLLKNSRSLSVSESVGIVARILNGLAFLHCRSPKIIHKDLKPANIMLKNGIPLIGDFGIARHLYDGDGSRSNTRQGSPIYMAPEAFDNRRNELTDIWSVGVILYEVLAGTHPWIKADNGLIQQIMANDPPPLSTAIPVSVRDVVSKAMETAPRERFHSAAEMRDALIAAVVPNAQQSKSTIYDLDFDSHKNVRSDIVDVREPGIVARYLRWVAVLILLAASAATGAFFFQKQTEDPSTNRRVEAPTTADTVREEVKGDQPISEHQARPLNSVKIPTPEQVTSDRFGQPDKTFQSEKPAKNAIDTPTKRQPIDREPASRNLTMSRRDRQGTKSPMPNTNQPAAACPVDDVDCLFRKARKQ